MGTQLQPTKMKYYSGIGSRQTPPDILLLMTAIAAKLEKDGWTLRSGGAGGADEAFAAGVINNAEIWIPWKNFVKKKHPLHTYKLLSPSDHEAADAVKKYHPAPQALSNGGFLLHSRNYRQIVGLNAPNSRFVICWTPNAELKGGTATAMKIAKDLKIPIHNLADSDTRIRFEKYIGRSLNVLLMDRDRREPEEMSDWESLEEDPMNEQFYGQG